MHQLLHHSFEPPGFDLLVLVLASGNEHLGLCQAISARLPDVEPFQWVLHPFPVLYVLLQQFNYPTFMLET